MNLLNDNNNVENLYVDSNVPKLAGEIYYNDLYAETGGKWIVGSLENDSSILVTYNKISVFRQVLSKIDGRRNIEELQNEINTLNIKCDVKEIIIYLSANGIVEYDNIKKKDFSEIRNLSINLFSIRLTWLVRFLKRNMTILDRFYEVLFFFMVSLFVFNTLNNNFGNLFLYENSVLKGYLISNVSMVISLLLHEFSHCYQALKKGLNPEKLSFVLYFGWFPMFYIKIPNMYSLERNDLLQVISAGAKSNIFQALFWMNLYFISRNELFKMFALGNISIFIYNLMPISLTDGYFYMSIMLRKSNLRLNLYKFVMYVFNKSKKIKLDIDNFDRIYYVLAISFILIGPLFNQVHLIYAIFSLLGIQIFCEKYILLIIPILIIFNGILNYIVITYKTKNYINA